MAQISSPPPAETEQRSLSFLNSRDLALCGLGAFAGLSVTMITLNFWIGVGITTVSVILFLFAIIRFIENKTIKYIGSAVTVIAYFLIIWSIYVPASVRVILRQSAGNYEENSDVFGLKWRKNYSELTAVVENYSDTDMLNIDMLITTNLVIVGAGFGPGINNCTSEAVTANMFIGKITFSYTDKNGNEIEAPFLDRNRPIASSLYRVRCERLSSKSLLAVTFPILTQNWTAGEPKKPPQWAVVWISFMAGYRPVHWRIPQCFEAPCGDIPKDISEVPLSIGRGEWTTIPH